MANARAKAEQADLSAERATQDCEIARLKAKEYAPEFHQPGTDVMKKQDHGEHEYDFRPIQPMQNHAPYQPKSYATPRDPNSLEYGMTPSTYDKDYGSSNRRQNNVGHNLNPGYPYNPGGSGGPGGGGGGGLGGGGGGLGGGGMQQETMQALNVSPHSRSPSLKIRRYSFLAGSRRGRGFSEIFNSTILNDHFDQYSAPHDDSGLGKEIYVGDERAPARSKVNPSDTSPDSGVSDSMEDESKNRPILRRRTLPCIINQTGSNPKREANAQEPDTAHSSDNLSEKNQETFIIENGIRRRVRADVHGNPPESAGGEKPHKAYTLESQKKLSETLKHGSLPDLQQVSSVIKPLARNEAYRLQLQRREEIRRLQELAERRRQGDVSVLLGDVKDWCQERQLLVLVIALNLSLATMFFNLLS